MVAPARVAAFEALQAVSAARTTLGDALAYQRSQLADERDRALTSEIALGTLRWRAALDHAIAWAAGRPLDRVDAPVVQILRLSAYQLLHLDRVPASAVVDDAVDLTRRAKRSRAAGFVNAALRRLSRQHARIDWPGKDRPLDFLAITLSQPRWLAARWMDRHGFEAAERWARFNNGHAPLTLRANTLRISRDDLLARLRAAGVAAEPTERAPHGVAVTSAPPDIEGLAVVQDESSQLVTDLVQARPGERVLDTCASPGNKTVAIAGDMKNDGFLVASDVKRRRMRLLSKTVAASGATCVRLVQSDLRQPLPFRDRFDAVLVDAPCSGLGTIRRDPDIKWRRQEADLAGLAAAQQQMLDHAAVAVRDEGRLVYATCSSEPEENEQVVEAFLRSHSEFTRPSDYFRTLPHEHGLEAFFGAVLIRLRS